MANPAVTFRLPALEREQLARVAEREGVSDSEILRRALEREIGSGNRLNLIIGPELARDLLDTAARLDSDSGEIVAILLRTHLPELTYDDVDPEAVRQTARAKARAALRSV